MNLSKTIIAALSVVTLAMSSVMPTHAFVGRLGSHSIGTVKRWQQVVARSSGRRLSKHDMNGSKTARLSGKSLRLVASKHKHAKAANGAKRVAKGPSSPSYFWSAPATIDSLLSEQTKSMIEQQFRNGNSEQYSPASLVQANVFTSCPLHGGVFKRRETVKNIILHSTETAREADAQRVISSWNNKGLRHAGAQFVVDRDGVIYCTTDPTYGTTHVDNRRTKGGINNDNSVGIEIVRAGKQEYSAEQMQSVVCLVRYLQERFKVADNHILGHGQVQPSDRSDPVNFNWQAFAADKEMLTRTAYSK
jgi:N-acetyl-anhydromuramyl-L-alanine amidase AmpD